MAHDITKKICKKSVLKIWQLVFLWCVKIKFGKLPLKWCIFIHEKRYFQQYCPLIVIILTKCIFYGIYIIFLSFFGAIRYSKDIFCFQESIFQWQISLISYRSGFWHLRRKPAVICSKCLFFQNSLVISWAT